ncbi:hypothetical protein DSO57_1029726 [Entomophthora muscae]|uniref:Uncharacterized protein n=1 Tax=Entomophthora muscae TaxID=34485 RepID=A0ACC2SE50_9FUNG|nr:hypothetical protein DSO57_1029726 [Entomophthora muscae]
MELKYNNCKVLISNVDVQASLFGSILIMVLGELSNNDEPTQRFAQTFVLCEQERGFFILNDIFRFLKDTNNSDVQGVGFVGVELEDGEFKVVNLPEKDSLQVNGSGPEKSSDASEAASLKAEPATPAEEVPAEPIVEAAQEVEVQKKKETPEILTQDVTPAAACKTPSTDSLKKLAVVNPKSQTEDKAKDADMPLTKKNEKADIKPATQSKPVRTSLPLDSKVPSAPKGTWAHLAGSGHLSSSEICRTKNSSSSRAFLQGWASLNSKASDTKRASKGFLTHQLNLHPRHQRPRQ